MPFYKLKAGPIFFIFSFCYFQKSHFPLERRGCLKNKQKQQPKKTHFYKLKTGPIMLRNILGPVFNLYLDQFLTYKICCFLCFLYFSFGRNPYFIVFSSKHAKFKETQRKKDTICEHNCANCSCQNVRFFFSAFFIFCCFFNFHFFRDVFDWFPKSKNTKNNKASKTKKQEQKEDKRCKAKTNEILGFKTKQDNKQNNRNQRTT